MRKGHGGRAKIGRNMHQYRKHHGRKLKDTGRKQMALSGKLRQFAGREGRRVKRRRRRQMASAGRLGSGAAVVRRHRKRRRKQMSIRTPEKKGSDKLMRMGHTADEYGSDPGLVGKMNSKPKDLKLGGK